MCQSANSAAFLDAITKAVVIIEVGQKLENYRRLLEYATNQRTPEIGTVAQ